MMLNKKFKIERKPHNYLSKGKNEKSSSALHSDNPLSTYEYATFQKKLFKEKRKQKIKIRWLIVVSIILAVLILICLPLLIKLFFGDGFLNYEL